MIGRVNAGGGGGLQSTDAILRVIAPAGSTVTISKGGVSKSDAGHENAADNTLYDYYFIIHASQFDSVNPWTVTATLGTKTKSSTIIIDSANEYDVVITYSLAIYKDGVINVPLGNNTGYTDSGTYLQLTKVASWRLFTTNTIDLSNYSTLEVDASNSSTGTNRWDAFGAKSTSAWNEWNHSSVIAITRKVGSYSQQTITVDLSSITSSGYVGAWGYNDGSSATIRIYRIELL